MTEYFSILDLDGVMMKSYDDLLSTLTWTFNGVATPIPFGNENIPFKPPNEGPWAFATILPVKSDQSLQTVDKYIRILQIDCNDDMNIGTGRLKALLVTKVLAYYAPRRLFSNTAGTQKFRVKKSDDGGVRNFGGHQQGVVSVTFDGSLDRAFS